MTHTSITMNSTIYINKNSTAIQNLLSFSLPNRYSMCTRLSLHVVPITTSFAYTFSTSKTQKLTMILHLHDYIYVVSPGMLQMSQLHLSSTRECTFQTVKGNPFLRLVSGRLGTRLILPSVSVFKSQIYIHRFPLCSASFLRGNFTGSNNSKQVTRIADIFMA